MLFKNLLQLGEHGLMIRVASLRCIRRRKQSPFERRIVEILEIRQRALFAVERREEIRAFKYLSQALHFAVIGAVFHDQAFVIVGGMALIGFVCWIVHSADPLWALIILAFIAFM